MEATVRLAITIFVLLLIALVAGLYYSRKTTQNNPFLSRSALKAGMDKPCIWLYYDTSDVNSRWWSDFGSRSSRALNMPFLNLCYESIANLNMEHYRIEVIGGLTGVAELLGGWSALPSGLQASIASVNEAELNWIRAAILARYGGIWLSPYSIAIKPFPAPDKMPKDRVIFFGTDIDETYSGANGTSVPGFRCIWSPKPEEPLFIEWEQICRTRLENKAGGQQIRGDAKWDWVALSSKYRNVSIDSNAEGARKQGGKRIQLEDLLATGHGGNLPFTLNRHVVYVPIFWPELRDREFYGWFLRMDERQIMQSDTSVKYLFQRSMTVA